MPDNVVKNVFTGDSSSAVRAIANLEKQVESLEKHYSSASSAAKQAAIAAKQAEKEKADAVKATAAAMAKTVKDGARESRNVFKTTVAALKQADNEAVKSAKQKESDRLREAKQGARESRSILKNYTAYAKQQEKEQAAADRQANSEKIAGARLTARELKRLAKEEKRSGDARIESVKQWALGMAGVFGIATSINEALTNSIEHQKELIRLADKEGRSEDRAKRVFATDARLNEQEADEAALRLRKVALKKGLNATELQEPASALTGSGWEWREATGGSLEALIDMRAAGGNKGNLEDLAKSVALGLNAQGLKQDQANIERLGSDIWALRGKGNVEAGDMEFLARSLSLAKDQSLEENLALFGTLHDVGNEETSATAFKNFHTRLRAPNSKTLKMMKKAGLDPKSVDFFGEDTGTVINRVAAARNRLPGDEQTAFHKELFGDLFLAQAKHVLDNPQRYQELLDAQKDKAGYRAAVKSTQSGMDFAARVSEEQRRQNVTNLADAEGVRSQQRNIARQNRGMSWLRADTIQGAGETARAVGAYPEMAEATASYTTNPRRMLGMMFPPLIPYTEGWAFLNERRQYSGVNAEAIRRTQDLYSGNVDGENTAVVKANNASTDENTKAMKEQTEVLKRLLNPTGSGPRLSNGTSLRPMPVDADEPH